MATRLARPETNTPLDPSHRQVLTIAIAILGAAIFTFAASAAMSGAGNRSALWNVGAGGVFALALALVLYLAVVLIEWLAFK